MERVPVDAAGYGTARFARRRTHPSAVAPAGSPMMTANPRRAEPTERDRHEHAGGEGDGARSPREHPLVRLWFPLSPNLPRSRAGARAW